MEPNDHVAISSVDALGRTVYIQIDSGVHSTPATLVGNERKAIYQYNVLNEALSVTDSDLAPQTGETVSSVNTAAQYNSLGRLTQIVDLERGTHTYSYDADGRLTSAVSGARTLGYSDDLLRRVRLHPEPGPHAQRDGRLQRRGQSLRARNTSNTSVLGTQGGANFPVGRLTQSESDNLFSQLRITRRAMSPSKMQYNKRGRPINASLLISASGGSLSFPTLPTYQQALSYNDANQLTTTTTSSNPSGLGYTFTNFYDSTTGVPTGLGNKCSSTANLATQSYNANALLNTLSLQTSTGTALASEQFSYDSNLRPTGATASWQSGSGNTGTILSQALTYDAGSDLTGATITQPAVPG